MKEQTTVEKNAGTLKGLSIQKLSLWMVAVTLVVSVLIGEGIIHVMQNHKKLADITAEYIFVREEAENLQMGSDFLTDKVRLYAVTKEPVYIEEYFTEVNETQRRDKALGSLEEHLEGKEGEILDASREALELSNELMDMEIHAMKLAALSVDEDGNKLLPEIKDYPLTEEELSFSSEEKSDAAIGLVFSEEYRDMKQKIEERISTVTDRVITICEEEQAESENAMRKALIRQSIYTVLIVALVIFSYIMIAVLILRPIRLYVNCIKNNHFLEITGAYEFKYLAATYNNVYEMTMEQQDMLRQKAERDALTGLLNRQSFEQLRERLRNPAKKLAFLLVDVDVFKAINDNYGHDVGDQALVKVANLLKDNFRKEDYVLRIGGDEFAVIMDNMTADKKQIIQEKVDAINEILQHPQGDFPKYSLSVGIAFSGKGFHEELFHQTDTALYHTKENGRCGYTFYDELAEDVSI